MNTTVIIAGAGASRRFNQSDGILDDQFAADRKQQSKIEVDLNGKPAFLRSIELFLKRPDQVGDIILAISPEVIEQFKFKWGDKIGFHAIKLVPGGKTERWETVLNALKEVSDRATHVAVHDAARPLATRALIDRLLEAAEYFDAVVPGLPVANTLKRAEADVVHVQEDPADLILGSDSSKRIDARRVIETVDRSQLYEIQTPQIFEIGLLRRAYKQITDGSLDTSKITDDAGLIEAMGEPVHILPGESANFKITRNEDVEFARAVAYARDRKVQKRDAASELFGD